MSAIEQIKKLLDEAHAGILAVENAQKIERERLRDLEAHLLVRAIEAAKRESVVEKREGQQKEMAKHLATARCERVAALEREEATVKKLEEVRRERDGYKAQLAKIHAAFPALA